MRKVYTVRPEWAKKFLRRLKVFFLGLQYHGKKRYCPVCGNSSNRFLQAGVLPREDALCFFCGAVERHRFLWLYLLQKTNIFDGTSKKMLHIAPEACFESKLKKKLGNGYLTADLFNSNVMVKMDITDIKYPDQYFNVIYCSHVLEHVQDDKKAMSEFYRVLKNDGWAILDVPITCKKTFEDPSIVDPLKRLETFGQEDHVRRYGLDYIDRLQSVGFNVEVTKVDDIVKSEEAVRMGLTLAAGDVYYCTK